MTEHIDAGALRAYLDHELPDDEAAEMAALIERDGYVAEQMSELQRLDARTVELLGDGATPDVNDALRRVRARLDGAPGQATRTPHHRLSLRGRKQAIAAAIAAALAVSLLVPGLRAAADSLLQVFRADKVVYISVSPQRVQQLQNLQADQNTLFLSPPQQVGVKATPQPVSSAAQASALTGFTVQEPTTFLTTPTSRTYSVMPRTAYQFQVNVQTLRQILSAFNITDVTVPDALGSQPISVVLPSSAVAQYLGLNYSTTLIEGTTPTASLPQGVDLAQLGKAALEVLGLPADQATSLSKQIDWRSTLVFPFPAGISNIQQVSVDGVTGVMVNSTGDKGPESVLYWQKGDRFYVLNGQGASIDASTMLATANSIK